MNDLKPKAEEAYRRLGGVGNPDARLIRGLSEQVEALRAEIARLKAQLNGTFKGDE